VVLGGVSWMERSGEMGCVPLVFGASTVVSKPILMGFFVDSHTPSVGPLIPLLAALASPLLPSGAEDNAEICLGTDEGPPASSSPSCDELSEPAYNLARISRMSRAERGLFVRSPPCWTGNAAETPLTTSSSGFNAGLVVFST
jgi:hypothetical protein